jgi:hypothetical protein
MHTSNDNTTSPRFGMRRLIVPWEYRHLRVFGVVRLGAGTLLIVFGALLLSYSSYGWAALFLVLGVLNLAGGLWYVTIADTASGRRSHTRRGT